MSDLKVCFYLAEDVIQQIDNKVSLIVLFPDNHILFTKPISEDTAVQESETIFLIDRVSLLINVSGGEGHIITKGQYFAPDGTAHGSLLELGEVQLVKDRSYNFIIKTNPFPINLFGTYTFLFYANDKVFTFEFTVSLN